MLTDAHNAHPKRRTNEGVENYAKAVYELTSKGEARAGTTAVADRVGVTKASASGMLRRMSDDGLVEYEPYRGARLTPAGERIALEVIRHHRLIELFLADVLGMPWDRVHREAEVLEHHISEELEDLIAVKLGEPGTDPHGDPIPDRDLAVREDHSIPLIDLEPGERAVFARISDSDEAMLRYLAERGIHPGARVRLRSHEPFGGPVVAEIKGKEHPLGEELARSMRVTREEDR
jgi:DtxR family transcriptional regulator, Mn-dependent transcriptional regulator